MVGSHTASASRGDALKVTARVPNDVPRAKYGACHLKLKDFYKKLQILFFSFCLSLFWFDI
jgi:hypothetical protein